MSIPGTAIAFITITSALAGVFAACGGDDAPTGSAPTPVSSAVQQPRDGTEVARRIASIATPDGSPVAVPPTAAVTGAEPSAEWDGTYLYELKNNGIESELLLNVEGGALRVAQFDISNGTGVTILQAPEVTVSSGEALIRANIEGTWNASFPTGTGLDNGRGARMQITFPQPFDPRTAAVCLRIAEDDYGCFTLRPR